jgi:hypothetical protein
VLYGRGVAGSTVMQQHRKRSPCLICYAWIRLHNFFNVYSATDPIQFLLSSDFVVFSFPECASWALAYYKQWRLTEHSILIYITSHQFPFLLLNFECTESKDFQSPIHLYVSEHKYKNFIYKGSNKFFNNFFERALLI